MVFAFAAVPLIIAGKRLFNHKVVQAIVQRNLRVCRRIDDLILVFIHLFDYWCLDYAQIGGRTNSPLDNNDQISCISSSDHVFEIFAFLWELKVTVIRMIPATELTVSSVVINKPFVNLLVIEDLEFVILVFTIVIIIVRICPVLE